MSAIDRLRALARPSRLVVTTVLGLSVAGIALAADTNSPEERVRLLLKTRLPKTPVTAIDCGKISGLCEITAGANLFYVDSGARFLVIGRVYDMQTRQDITAARLLEMNPDMLVGAAAKANAAANVRVEVEFGETHGHLQATKVSRFSPFSQLLGRGYREISEFTEKL